MPITRRQLTSNAASTSKPAQPPPRHLVPPISDDDLFEQSAIQVSSATRPTRTINHQIPTGMRKALFKPAVESNENNFSALNNQNTQISPNNRNNKIITAKIPSSTTAPSTIPSTRPLVKRSMSIPKGNQSTIVASNSSVNSSATKIPLSAPKRPENEDDDSIFDVPLSPSPAKQIHLLHGAPTASTGALISNVISTPSKKPLVAKTNGSLLTPSKLNLQFNPNSPTSKLLAGSRKTPLTTAEKRRREHILLDKATKTEIALFQTRKRNENCDPVIEIDGSDKIEDNKEAKYSKIDGETEEKTVTHDSTVAYLFTGTHENVLAYDRSLEVDENKKPTLARSKHFIRNQATESAPPDIISGPSKAFEEEAPVTEENALSLVIEVPPPPKLEDLETLDPELYVKIKSGNLKDDLSIPFISESDRQDIESFLETFVAPEFVRTLLPVAIIGEGTFSTVYKVIDKSFYECENGAWLDYSRQNPLDWLRLWRWVYTEIASNNSDNKDKFVLFKDGKRCVDRHGRTVPGTKTSSSSSTSSGKLGILLRRYLLEWAVRSLDSLLPSGEPSENILSSITPRVIQSAMLRFRPFFIALKRINSTSSPQRILDEMSFLKLLGGKNNVVPLINGLRHEDQVLVTFPYFYSEEFREFLNSGAMTVNSIACYMRSLFISLAHLHHHSIIHRDVKPSNFLYAPESGGRAVLLDFGLAQKANSSSSTNRGSKIHASTQRAQSGSRNNEKERKKLQAVNMILNTLVGTGGSAASTGEDACDKIIQLTGQLGPGYLSNDPRAGMKASRAGTRGFRAPEVLFKCPNQTTALDIWSAGSSDDFDAIVEIANIFGNEEMSAAARLYNRKWQCNVPSVPEKHLTWPVLCSNLHPSFSKDIPSECYDLVAECLNLNSDKRITARNALRHPFIAKYAK